MTFMMKKNMFIYNLILGIQDCMKKMYKNEGLGAFWRGILPPILAESPKRAVKVKKKKHPP